MSTPDPEPLRLTLLTFDQTTPEPPCEGGYLCCCKRCERERDQAVKRGVRRTQPLPLKRAA